MCQYNRHNRQIPPELLCEPQQGNNVSWQAVGRVVKRFDHSAVVLMRIIADGRPIPVAMKKDTCTNYEQAKKHIQIGDILAVQGIYVAGRRGEQELRADRILIVKPCLLRSEQTGLLAGSQYTGQKARQYYHTLMNTDSMCTFLLLARSQMMCTLQHALAEEGYVCCTTPVLQHSHFAGGARPFITHMLDNGSDMFLRVTSEIALKHIIAGGLERVYEIGNSFRNGSVNATHNTPFMGAEIYRAYCTEPEHRRQAVALIRRVQEAVTPLFDQFHNERKVDFSPTIPEVSFEEYIRSKGFPHFSIGQVETYPELPELGTFSGVEHLDAKLLYKWFKNVLIINQIQPILVTDMPSGISPLIARKDAYSLHRSYLVANGATLMEIAQSETEYEKVHAALLTQQQQKGGDSYFCDYSALLHAYQMGIPPMCSLFVGLDRVIPALLGADSINQYSMYL